MMSHTPVSHPGPSTSLTPAMGKLLHDPGAQYAQDKLRNLVADALEKNMIQTATFMAEELVNSPQSTDGDKILFAKCFFRNGEHQRCIAALEYNQLLNAIDIKQLSEHLSPKIQGRDGQPMSLSMQEKLSAILLAAQCLQSLGKYDDCVMLLEALVTMEDNEPLLARAIHICQRSFTSSAASNGLNTMACLYSTIGRCYDSLENRARCVRALSTAVRIDPTCTEAAEHLTSNHLLTPAEKQALFLKLSFGPEKEYGWLKSYYRLMLLSDVERLQSAGGSGPTSSSSSSSSSSMPQGGGGGGGPSEGVRTESAISLVRRAEYCLEELHQLEGAYQLSRQAYAMDPYDKRCLIVYIGCLVELRYTTELFYLGHELTKTCPKASISWYAVGCYYLSCQKLELAHKFLQKVTKMDKRFAKALVALGHVLSAQDESEHAISAFRAAGRLMPGDHRPAVLMAKELHRTNNYDTALHLLSGALEIRRDDPVVLNEMGVTYLKLGRTADALDALAAAAALALKSARSDSGNQRRVFHSQACGEEIYNNFASALRVCGRYAEALRWYERALGENPLDSNTHAAMGFTLHLMARFDEAITSYHRALALQPSTFCSEMLTRAMEDSLVFVETSSLKGFHLHEDDETYL